MTKYIFVGTSHISKKSIKDIKDAFLEHKPTIIAVELDKKRLAGLLSKKKAKTNFRDVRRVGFKGFLFATFGGFIQKRLGKVVGVSPGSEMVSAVKLAKDNNLPVALIDQDIEVTLRRLSKGFSWRERCRLVADVFKGLIMPKRELKKYGFSSFDLNDVPSEEFIEKIMGALEKRYPNIYRVLVMERNKFMTRALLELGKKFPEAVILVVIGAGHKKEIEEKICSANFF